MAQSDTPEDPDNLKTMPGPNEPDKLVIYDPKRDGSPWIQGEPVNLDEME